MAATCRNLAVVLLLVAGLAVAPGPAHAASPPVCALYCDTRDPSLARQETVSTQLLNGRRLALHVSDVDGPGSATTTRPARRTWCRVSG